MSFSTKPWLALITVAALAVACKKEVEKIVVQEVSKTYSWMPLTPARRLAGVNSIVVQMSKSDDALLLQSPFFLNIISPTATSATRKSFGYVGSLAAYFPGDIFHRLPLSRDVVAQPVQDTLVQLQRPTEVTNSSYNAYVNLRQLDPKALEIVWPDGINHPAFGAINRDNYLLFSYRIAAYDNILRFGLTRIRVQPTGDLQAKSLGIRIALPANIPSVRPRWIQAIDDYFLVNCGDAGLYKIQEDGTARLVYSRGYSTTDACYKWRGVVYLVEEYNSILLSKDDGETWQRFTGTPDLFDFATYHVAGDSLIGVGHQGINQLFTLRWNGSQYSTRMLKSDGLGLGEVRGLEQLGDTVYIGTTNGLFKRPLKQFFDSK